MVLQHLAQTGHLDHGLKIRTMTMPDTYMDQMAPSRMIENAGLDAGGIAQQVMAALDLKSAGLVVA